MGEGGFGTVYIAQQTAPVRRRVALKIIKLGMDTRRVVARFESERQVLALMDHPGIAKVFDGGATEQGRPYFVMELVTGRPITEYCDAHAHTIAERLELIAQVCDALQHAHQKGVIHRDIKPSNVLVTEVDSRAVPKIIDFGIAKATDAGDSQRTILTEQHQMIGTPAYMSPEQAGESSEDVDTRTDVYSVGVLMYELLVGQTPLDFQRLRSASLGEMQRMIREEDPPKPSSRLSQTPETSDAVASKRATRPERLVKALRGELDWIVMRAMEKDRNRRYESAGAMSRDVRRYLAGHAVQAAPPGRIYQIRKFARRYRGPALAAAALAIAMIAGIIGTSLGLFRAQEQREAAERATNRADTTAERALDAEALAIRQAYAANLMSASAAVNNVQFNLARGFLDAASERLRGWEWRVLMARLDSSVRAFPPNALMPDLIHVDSTSMMIPDADGQRFLTFNGGTAHQWDARTGRLIRMFEPSPSDAPISVSVSADSRVLTMFSVTAGTTSPNLRTVAWDLENGAKIGESDVLLSELPSSKVVAAADGMLNMFNFDHLSRFDPKVGKILAEKNIPFMVFYQEFSPDASLWAAVDAQNVIHLFDTRSLEEVKTLSGHSGLLTRLQFSNDSHWVGSSADDDTARVWDLKSAASAPVVLRHQGRVQSICFSQDNSLVATTARDRALRVWDRATGALRATYPNESPLNPAMMFMPDGKTIAAQESHGPIRLWDLSAQDTTVLTGHTYIVSHVRFVPSNAADIIISCGWDGLTGETGMVRLWDADSGDMIGVHRGQVGEKAAAVAVSRDGRFAAIAIQIFREHLAQLAPGTPGPPGDQLGRTEVIDLTTGRLVFSVPSRRRPEWVGFGSDGRTVIMASALKGERGVSQIDLLDERSAATIRTRSLPSDAYRAGSPRPDGQTLTLLPDAPAPKAATSTPAHMLILDTRTLETLDEVEQVVEGARSLAFNADGSRMASCDIDGILRIYRTDTGELLAGLAGHGMEILAVSFSPDGKRIASAGLDRQVRIWEASTFDQLGTLGGHSGHIGGLDWSPTPLPGGDYRLASCSGDSTIRIWEPVPIRTRVEAANARHAVLLEAGPLVDSLFEVHKDPQRVVERIHADLAFRSDVRRAALQIVLRRGLESRSKGE